MLIPRFLAASQSVDVLTDPRIRVPSILVRCHGCGHTAWWLSWLRSRSRVLLLRRLSRRGFLYTHARHTVLMWGRCIASWEYPLGLLSTLLFPREDSSNIISIGCRLGILFVPLVMTHILRQSGILRLLRSGLGVVRRLFGPRLFPSGLVSGIHRDLHLRLAMFGWRMVGSIPRLGLIHLLCKCLR